MKKILLILILVLAFILRFWKLDSYPAFNADEAAIGYNAYSLIQTGKDEHGNPWPIHFQSFNDYKPGLYFYLVVPFVKVLGLNEWAVRIPGATLGVLTVLVMYFLVLELFKDHKSLVTNHQSLGLIASLFLAISPWHIHFSRGGWEVNAATFFITTGVLLFLKGLKNPKLLVISFSLLVASLYTYHAARIIVPLLGLGLVFIYAKELLRRENIKSIVFGSLLMIFLLIPLARDLFGPAGISRLSGVGLLSSTGPINRTNEQRGEHINFQGSVSKIFHNKVVNYGLSFVENWGKHYWGEFLFLTGDDIQRNKVPETGQMYLLDILWLVIGGWWLVKNIGNKGTQLILYWLLVAPIASALTFQSPHALRAHNMVVPLVIISALGLTVLIDLMKKLIKPGKLLVTTQRQALLISYSLLVILTLWQFARYQHMYWVHMAKEYPYSSQYGVKELVSYIKENGSKYSKILTTDRYDQPYILFLFYLKYDPIEFQKDHLLTPRDRYGFSTVNRFSKYYFDAIKFDQVRPENPSALIIGTPEEIPEGANVVKEIYGSNGYKYFQVVAN